MYSDAVSQAAVTTKIVETGGFYKSIEVFEKWLDWQASEISHHGKTCCEIAREWIMSTDFSEIGGASSLTGPRWLRQRFDWGAASFPIFWCEAVRKKKLDCGALAALASAVFTVRGVKNYRVQMVQRFSEASNAQWSNSWQDTSEQLRWMNDDLIYHEGCAIDTGGGEIKIWDVSAGWWLDSKAKDGYGALLAIRLSAFNLSPNAQFTWGEHRIESRRWTNVI